ncbi:glycosyltransferase family 9 protein [Myxococcota bacterium]|nr:glycosyltransferase family 9 protein [Myxococcota bacterium]
MGRLGDSIDRIRGLSASTSGRWDPRLFAKDRPSFSVRDRRVLLAYLFSGLGDAVLLAPVIRAVLDAGAKPPVGVLVPKGAGARLLTLVDLPMKLHLLGDTPADHPKVKAQLRAKRYELAADLSLRDGLDARPFLEASDAPVLLGFLREGETLARTGLTFGAPDTRTEAMIHWSRSTAQPLAAAGIERPSWDVALATPKEAKKAALALFPSKRGPRIVLVPGGRAVEKRWDAERFVAIGRAMIERHRASVVVLGSPAESKLARGIAKALGERARPYVGRDLATLVELVRAADAVVTNDTGPMHVAFLLGVPTVAIFTYMSPVVWGPPKSDPRFVVLNARGVDGAPPGDGGDDVWARLALHHLEGLVARRPAGPTGE